MPELTIPADPIVPDAIAPAPPPPDASLAFKSSPPAEAPRAEPGQLAAVPAPPAVMYSPDGRFFWNGQNWLQVAPAAPQYAPGPSMQYNAQPSTAPSIVVQNMVNTNAGGVRPMTTRNKTVAAILALLLGGLGIHKFYLGRGGMGVVYLLFCWTFIPIVLGLIDGIVLLVMDDRVFNFKYANYTG